MMSNTVISICSISHSDVWMLTSNLLPLMVKAEKYIVYVPFEEISHFKSITNPAIEVVSQDTLGLKYKEKLQNAVHLSQNDKRFGWYLQQFFKIEAIQLVKTDNVTIWDADCVPVSPIETQNSDGQIMYVNSSREFHPPYFENVKRLLGMDRIQDICFVIPSFPMKKIWIEELIQSIEEQHGMSWSESIISTTDFTLMSGFSETETLGTWVANKYPTEWASRFGTWERYGQSRFGYARDISQTQILEIGKRNNLEIITFENWDLRGRKRLIHKLVKIAKRFK